MSNIHSNLNRPVHMARRDVYYERAVELLYMPTQHLDTVLRVQHIEHILSLLDTSQRHAGFSMRSANATPDEEDFLRFLGLMSDNVRAVHSMVSHQLQMESGGGFLSEFLGATPSEALLPALHYQRRAEDILQGLWHVLRLAQTPYQGLHERNANTLSESESNRYARAIESCRDEVRAHYPVTDVSAEAVPDTG